MSRVPGAGLLGLALAALLVGLLVADQSCRVVTGRVIEKREGIEELIDPFWRPTRDLVVAFEPRLDEAIRIPWQPERWSTGFAVAVPAGEVVYDQLRPGSSIQVRYFPPLPDLARVADQSLAEYLLTPLIEDLRESGLVLLALLLVWLVVAMKRRWYPGFFTTDPRKLGLLVIHLLALQAFPIAMLGLRDLLPPPGGPRLTTTAVVQDVDQISSIGHTRYGSTQRSMAIDLPRPFERVQLRFVPAGRDQPVVAVDEVTPGSVARLATGEIVPISYAQAQPRAAWIEPASREHRLENRLYVHALVTVPFLLLVVALPGLMLILRLVARGLTAGR